MTRQLLLRLPGQLLDWRTVSGWPLDPAVLETAQLHHAVDHPETYVRVFTGQAAALLPRLQAVCPAARIDVLTLTQSIAGASDGQCAAWFYTVETDVAPAVDDDFNRWYGEEHLPGLAAVNGTVRAERWLSETSSPRYVATYALTSRETFGCPAWLAVRATPWSDRIRPHFLNTKRTMFATLPHPERL